MERTKDALDNKTEPSNKVGEEYVVGSALRKAREARNETISEVAQMLRINWRYLEALEQERFNELPGTAYITGFIRTYAEHLEIDSIELVSLYKGMAGGVTKKTKLDFPSPIPESGVPGGAIIFAGFLLAIIAYGTWYMATEEDSFIAKLVTPVPNAQEEASSDGSIDVQDGAQSNFTPPVDTGNDLVEETIEPEVQVESVEEVVVETSEPVEEPVAEEITSPPLETLVESIVETVVDPEVTETVSEVVQAQVPEPEVAVEETAPELIDIPVTEVEAEAVVEAVIDPIVVPVVPVEAVLEPVIEVAPSVEPSSEPEIAIETVADIQESVNSDISESENTTTNDDSLALNQAQFDALQSSIASDSEPEAEVITTEAAPDLGSALVEAETETETMAPNEPEADEIAAAPSGVDAVITGRIYGEQGEVRVVVVAKINSWIQVKDDNTGELLLTRMLRKGDAYRVPDQKSLTLLTGNAGALEIFVDGQTVPPIGSSGAVQRNVSLDADLLLAGEAASQ